MIYGYARVSTRKQSRDGNSLEDQIKRLKERGAKRIYADSYTGTKMSRPELDKLLAVLKSGDTVVVTKLDRIARTTIGGIELIRDLCEKGITVDIMNMGVVDNTPMGRLVLTVMLAFAEYERDMIVQRTQEGKEVAREKEGWKDGRKPVEVDVELFKQCRERVSSGVATVTECCEELGIGRTTWYKLQGEYALEVVMEEC